MRRLIIAASVGGILAWSFLSCGPSPAKASAHACISTVEICSDWYEYIAYRAASCGCTDCDGATCISEDGPCPRYR